MVLIPASAYERLLEDESDLIALLHLFWIIGRGVLV
jgi:hypothetical protein